MSKRVLKRLQDEFGDAILSTHSNLGDDTAIVETARWRDIAFFLRDDSKCQMDHFIDLTAVDYLDRRALRYEVVLHVRSMDKLHRVRLKTPLAEVADGLPQVASLQPVWRGADWFERECYDMFGIEFVDHPDLRRILMYEEFVGHPLRKDYPAAKAQPLIPYREGINNEKLPPFDAHEGLPFGRQTHAQGASLGRGARNLLGFEDN